MGNWTRRDMLRASAAAGAAWMAPAARAETESLKLGMTTALTGSYSEFGVGLQRGVELALAAVNARGGVKGAKLELGVLLDDQFIPDRAVQNMRRILDNKDIIATICPSGSGPTMATVDMATADGRPQINTQAQAPQITYPNGLDKPPRPNLFSVAVQNNVDGAFMSSTLARKYKKIGILHENTSFGKSGADQVASQIKTIDPAIAVTNESYTQKDQDMTAQLVRLNRANTEAILIVGLGADCAVIRRGMVRLALKQQLYTFSGGITAPFLEGAGEMVVGTRGSSAAKIARQPTTPETKVFLDAYKSKFGADRWWGPDPDHPHPTLSTTVGAGYDAVLVYADALTRASDTAAANLIKALESTTNFAGAVGDYTFTPARHHSLDVKDLGFFEYTKVDGRIELLPIQV